MQPIGADEEGNLLYENDVQPHVIRTSERTNFKKCRRLWDYNSGMRQNYEPVRMNQNLAFGIAVHVGLEHYYEPERWSFPTDVKLANAISAFVGENKRQMQEESAAQSGLDHERKLEYKEREELGVAMLTGYAEWAAPQDKFTPLAVEEKFQVPLVDLETGKPLVYGGRPVVYQVRLDMLLEDEQGRRWVLDHKTAGSFWDLGFLDLDTQISSYAWAAQQHYGGRIAGIVYNELLKTAPSPPKVLTKGNLSQDKRQNTTYKLYKQAIDDLGLDPGPYSGMLDYLRDNEKDYFRRTQVFRSQSELDLQGQLILMEVKDMLGDPFIYPNPSKMHCNGCDFRAPCAVENEVGDVEFVLNDPFMYRPRPKG